MRRKEKTGEQKSQPGNDIVLAAEDGKAAFTDMSFAKLKRPGIDHDTHNGTNAVKTYGFSVQAVHTENGQDTDIVIQNQNPFRINEIAVTVTNHAAASECACVQKNQYYITSLTAGESWHSKETENKTGKASRRAVENVPPSVMRCLMQMTITIILSLQETAMRRWKRRKTHRVKCSMPSGKPCFAVRKFS